MKKLSLFVIASIMFMACNNQEQLPQLTAISLNKKSISVEVGDNYKLRVIYEPSEAEDGAPEIVWESSKPKVASVDEKGVVTAKSVGTAVITASCGKLSAECEVEVTPEAPPVPVESIELDKTELDLKDGDIYVLQVIYTPAESKAKAPAVVWTSSNESVATVSEGTVRAKGPGTAVITADCDSHTATCKVSVTSDKIGVSPNELTFSIEGGTEKLTVSSNIAWTATSSVDWLTLSATEGEGNADVTLTCHEGNYNSTQDSQGSVTFTNAENSVTVNVTRTRAHIGFSVSATKRVLFSPGNLQYNIGSASWRFASEQFNKVAMTDNDKIDEPSYTGYIDLFGWGTGNNPTKISTLKEDYQEFHDWGKNVIGSDPAGTWYTLSRDEWFYLLKERPNANKKVTLTYIESARVMLIFPDSYKMPEGLDFKYYDYFSDEYKFTMAQWRQMEARGAVAIPTTGIRIAGGVNSSTFDKYIYVWTSTPDTGNDLYSYMVCCGSSGYPISVTINQCYFGASVRLVKDAE